MTRLREAIATRRLQLISLSDKNEAGNVLSKDVYKYSEEERSYYALNAAVTADNYMFKSISNHDKNSQTP